MSSGPNVDWRYAGAVARRIGGSGPTIGREGAHQAVEELRAGAAVAVDVVALPPDYTPTYRLTGSSRRPATMDRRQRRGIRDGHRSHHEKLARSGRRDSAMCRSPHGLLVPRWGCTGLHVITCASGSTAVPRQRYATGNFYFVAPNIVEVQHRLAVNSSDFRLWVAFAKKRTADPVHRDPWLGPWLRRGSVRRWTTLLDARRPRAPAAAGARGPVDFAPFVALTSSRHFRTVMSDEEHAVFDRSPR